MLKKISILLNLIILSLLSACGSTSSSLKDNVLNENNGEEECINLPKILAGDVHTIRIKSFKVPSSSFDTQIAITNISDTELAYDITIVGDSEVISSNVDSISIHDNFIDIYKTQTTDLSTGLKNTVKFSPYMRTLYNRTCKGMTWGNDFNATSAGSTINKKYTSTVESISETKSIELGTYTTIKIKTEEEDGSSSFIWEDINEAKTILVEQYDVNGNLTQTQELISE